MRRERIVPKISLADLLWIALSIAIAVGTLGLTAWQVWLATR